MSRTLGLECGCVVLVDAEAETGLTRMRVIQHRGAGCRNHAHQVGARVFLWELLPARQPLEYSRAARTGRPAGDP